MTTYYTEENGKITQSADWPFPGHTHTADREIVHGYDGQLYFAGDEPVNPNPPLDPVLSAAIAKRDALLSATDWYAIRSSEPGGKPIPDTVLEYRQALREIDKQPGWPDTVNWPVLSESE